MRDMQFDSSSSSIARDEDLDHLMHKVHQAYTEMVLTLQVAMDVSTSDQGADALVREIRELCERLENLLELLINEQEEPELDLEEIEGGVCCALGEVDSLRSRVSQLVERMRGRTR